ncbi:uncharacterized protein LOC111676068 [Lucilia cuprina]|uniref:uncharacterized protein LOC111676068 n=1 Tax=Lucilia cuprina TaxID=7375 RepID=UPI001F06B9F3|nr:uncharacterized protein LOC111676068 [Lucilia cuprina]
MNTKYQPPKSPYHKHEFNICTEPTSFDPLFMENINDVADTLVEIMIICGIHRCKAKASKSTVIKSFQFYDIKRHRFDVAIENEKGISRNDMICNFQCKCMMTYIEALLAYGIVKRAVKAFYHGTPDFSIRSPITEAVILKEQEFIWQHAATRTVQLFEPYEHIFFNAHQNYAQLIVKIYKELHNRIKSRADPVLIEDYHPRGCVKKVVIGTKSPPKLDGEKPRCVEKCGKIEEMKNYIKILPDKKFPLKNVSKSCEFIFGYKKLSPPPLPPSEAQTNIKKTAKKYEVNLPRCYQCNCPKLICDCDIETDTGILAIECSQGPYQCQWVRIDKNDKPDPCIEKRELHQCPIDCPTSESSSEEDENQWCECSEGNESDENRETVEEQEFEETDNEESFERLMPKNLPKRKSTYECEKREISKLPIMKFQVVN